MYARIVAGVDQSDHSGRALGHAVCLAKALGAALRVVHVVEMGWLPVAAELGANLAQVAAAWRSHGQSLLDQAADVARREGLAAETRLVETGSPTQQPAAALLAAAASWKADVIVIGARGRSGVERLLLGSMADGVARRSTVPVVLVP